jgi:phage terminase large subunit
VVSGCFERRAVARPRVISRAYGHIWEGEYAKAFDGAYFARQLEQAKAQKRIGRLGFDPIHEIRAFWDIGGAGAKADATAIWVCQFIGREIRVVDYVEGIGQTLGYYIGELKRRGWARCKCTLPHDSVVTNNFTGKRF